MKRQSEEIRGSVDCKKQLTEEPETTQGVLAIKYEKTLYVYDQRNRENSFISRGCVRNGNSCTGEELVSIGTS
jgi:hypothetical protein